jgi:hypothetical protein
MTVHGCRGVSLLSTVLLACSATLVGQGSNDADDFNLPVFTQAVNLAISTEGQVIFKRKLWTNFAPLVFGTELRLGDLLRLDAGSRAIVVCSDLTVHDIGVGIAGVPCLKPKPLLRRADGSVTNMTLGIEPGAMGDPKSHQPQGSFINPTRGRPVRGSFPMVLTPRRTKLLSNHPILRWTAVAGADSYDVIVRGPDLFWSSRVHSANEIKYPDKAPPLEPGVDYKLVVQTNDRSSSAEPGLGLGFSILDSKERKAVLNEQKQIEALGLPDGPTQFLLAHVYIAHDLNAEAIERLEGASQTFKAAAISRLLGNLYWAVGLTREAEAQFLNSLDLSKYENDDEGQMLANLALARIYDQWFGNESSARKHLEAALALAKTLGDDHAANQARKQLAELKRPGT